MTLLISWVGVDTHGPSSLYMASDSRISWNAVTSFDFGRKVIAFNNHPDILGYCGDVLFPVMVLGQIKDMADAGMLFENTASSDEKYKAIKTKIIETFNRYPSEQTTNIIQIIHASREMSSGKFFCRLLEWNKEKSWKETIVPLPSQSNIIYVLGSGASEFNDNYKTYQDGPNKNTSRNVFHCFCNTLFNIHDPHCGGAPQLSGIIRRPNSKAINYGIIRQQKRYYSGIEINNLFHFEKIEWRNDLFELCNGYSMDKLLQAQPQPDIFQKRNK